MINRHPKAGVIGWPIEHSLSPYIHRFWLEQYSIEGQYLPIAVKPNNLENFLRGLHENDWCGVNITLPHKRAAMKIVDDIDSNAQRVGAINTIIVQKDGSLKGTNTDGHGFLNNLRDYQPTWDAKGGPVVVLGAGGAARSIVAALIDSGSPEVRLVNRSRGKAERLSDDLNGRIKVYNWSDRSKVLMDARLLVNTTSLGMLGQSPLTIDLKNLPEHAIVNDIVYTPITTDLLRNAQKREIKTVDGLGMLLHQACFGFSAWYGVDPGVSISLRTHILNMMKN